MCKSESTRTKTMTFRVKAYRTVTLRKVERAMEGRVHVTLMLKDPFGNSAILSQKTKTRRMSVRELNKLKFGEHAIAARKRP